jgi:hypothetical protein
MQIRRMTISIYIIFIAFWRGEITRIECEQAINNSLEVFGVLGTRWRSAIQVRRIVIQLADRSGEYTRLTTSRSPAEDIGLSYKEPVLEEPAASTDVSVASFVEGVRD